MISSCRVHMVSDTSLGITQTIRKGLRFRVLRPEEAPNQVNQTSTMALMQRFQTAGFQSES